MTDDQSLGPFPYKGWATSEVSSMIHGLCVIGSFHKMKAAEIMLFSTTATKSFSRVSRWAKVQQNSLLYIMQKCFSAFVKYASIFFFPQNPQVKQKKNMESDSFEYCNLLFLYESCLIIGMICDDLEHFEVVVSRSFQ